MIEYVATSLIYIQLSERAMQNDVQGDILAM